MLAAILPVTPEGSNAGVNGNGSKLNGRKGHVDRWTAPWQLVVLGPRPAPGVRRIRAKVPQRPGFEHPYVILRVIRYEGEPPDVSSIEWNPVGPRTILRRPAEIVVEVQPPVTDHLLAVPRQFLMGNHFVDEIEGLTLVIVRGVLPVLAVDAGAPIATPTPVGMC